MGHAANKLYINKYIHTYIHTYIYIYTYIIRMYIYTYMYIHIYEVHTYVPHTYVSTYYIHTYRRTDVHPNNTNTNTIPPLPTVAIQSPCHKPHRFFPKQISAQLAVQ